MQIMIAKRCFPLIGVIRTSYRLSQPSCSPRRFHEVCFARQYRTRRVTLLVDLVGTSQRVGATSARLHKVRELAGFLRALPPEEIETAVQYLSGETPQGRIGIGYSTLQAAASKAAIGAGTLSIAEVDQC